MWRESLKKDRRVRGDNAKRIQLIKNDSNGVYECRHQRWVQVRFGFIEKHQ